MSDNGEQTPFLDKNDAADLLSVVECAKHSTSFEKCLLTLDELKKDPKFPNIFGQLLENENNPDGFNPSQQKHYMNLPNSCKEFLLDRKNFNMTLGQFIEILDRLNCTVVDVIKTKRNDIYAEVNNAKKSVTNVEVKSDGVKTKFVITTLNNVTSNSPRSSPSKKIPIVYYDFKNINNMYDMEYFIKKLKEKFPGIEFDKVSLKDIEQQSKTRKELTEKLERFLRQTYPNEVFLIYEKDNLHGRILNMDHQINLNFLNEETTMRIFYSLIYGLYCKNRLTNERFFGFCLGDFERYKETNRFGTGFKFMWLLQALGETNRYAKMVQIPENNVESRKRFDEELNTFYGRFSDRIFN